MNKPAEINACVAPDDTETDTNASPRTDDTPPDSANHSICTRNTPSFIPPQINSWTAPHYTPINNQYSLLVTLLFIIDKQLSGTQCISQTHTSLRIDTRQCIWMCVSIEVPNSFPTSFAKSLFFPCKANLQKKTKKQNTKDFQCMSWVFTDCYNGQGL